MELLIEEVRARTQRHRVRFWKLDGNLAAEGVIVAACVQRDAATRKMKAVPIPERLRTRLEAAPAGLLATPATAPAGRCGNGPSHAGSVG